MFDDAYDEISLILLDAAGFRKHTFPIEKQWFLNFERRRMQQTVNMFQDDVVKH